MTFNAARTLVPYSTAAIHHRVLDDNMPYVAIRGAEMTIIMTVVSVRTLYAFDLDQKAAHKRILGPVPIKRVHVYADLYRIWGRTCIAWNILVECI